MNKKGQIGSIVLVFVVILVILSIVNYNFPSVEGALEKTPSIIGKTFNIIFSIINPIYDLLYAIIAPVGANDNTQAIAFAVFILLFFVGYTVLSGVFSKFLALIMSSVIGIIAARSLTDTVLENAALGASPIAVTSLILAFIPIYALTKKIEDWGLKPFSMLVVYLTAGAVYMIIFIVAFNAVALGITYGIGVAALGIGQQFVQVYKKAARKRKAEQTGETMKEIKEEVIEPSVEMGKGYRRKKKQPPTVQGL